MAYMAYPNVPAIHYKGFGGYDLKEDCEERIIQLENEIVDMETKRGYTAYVTVRCEEVWAFPEALELRKQQKKQSKSPSTGA